MPLSTMYAMSVWVRKKVPAKHRANTAEITKPTTARKMPLMAILSARLPSPAPSARPSRALTPTAVPVARPIIRFWAGKASVTAVRACSLTCETNTLSTILYRACTSIDAMMGRDIFQISLEMGMIPSLLSFIEFLLRVVFSDLFYILPRRLPKENAGKAGNLILFRRFSMEYGKSLRSPPAGGSCILWKMGVQ